MKASYDTPERFGKLTLEITDKEEADVLWHILSMHNHILENAWKQYSALRTVPDLDFRLIVNRMWAVFGNTYKPIDC